MNESLPWRGPGTQRPEIPLPPDPMPGKRDGSRLKRWRYVGVFADEIMVCAARIQVGPLGQTFWVIWDREGRKFWERTRLRLPGARGEVWTEQLGHEEDVVAELGDFGVIDHAPDEGSLLRIDATVRGLGQVRAFLRIGPGRWIESICPTPEDQYVWTRKRADVPVEGRVRLGERRWRLEGRGVEDESSGYHPKHTVWSWSAGVGRTRAGRSVGWNLISGLNDPPERSERAIWVDGEPFEPGPVTFEDLDAVRFEDGSRLEFHAESERQKQQNLVLVRYTYRQPLGTFTGSLPGGHELEHGLGVMEFHDATW